MKQFYVWLTTPSSEFANELVASLVKRGFCVGPLGRRFVITFVDQPADVIAMIIAREPKDEEEETSYTCSGIHDEVMNVLKVIKGRIYSIVVSEGSMCSWNTGNMSIKQLEKEAEEKKQLN